MCCINQCVLSLIILPSYDIIFQAFKTTIFRCRPNFITCLDAFGSKKNLPYLLIYKIKSYPRFNCLNKKSDTNSLAENNE